MKSFFTLHEHIKAQVQSCAFAIRFTTESLTDGACDFNDTSRMLAIFEQTLYPDVDQLFLHLEDDHLSVTVHAYGDDDRRYEGIFILDTRNACIIKDAHKIT